MSIEVKTTHILYGAFFVVATPIMLVVWASNAQVSLPVYGKPFIGYIVFGFGVILTVLGLGELLFKGRGLPLKLAPTFQFADAGAYAAMPHPIYSGFSIAVWGMAMAVQSASGLWLITPMVVLGCVAVVYGYERPFLRKTFPERVKKSRIPLPDFYTKTLRYIDSKINNWRELKVGSVRILSHGIYAGMAAMVGLLLFAFLHPTATIGEIFLLILFAVVGSITWGQFIEARKGVLRPFGYFGAVLGILLAVETIPGISQFYTLAALAVAMPFTQSLGRLRCLIHGCCHGHVCASNIGIHYHTPESAAVKAGLVGLSIHPTQLYSLVINFFVGTMLLITWLTGSTAANIVGTYLIATGCGRFIEEAYRGEPQTPHVFGLPLYQRLAIIMVIAGAVITCIPSGPVGYAFSLPSFPSLLMALLSLPIIWFVTGLDFPKSTSRYSRLT
ncbi:MAG: prolipoprotein diacylglyceryl transferase [Ignavibacteria bacterium]|nr:prolipoprotein diacylglyceryl transferase [Ignavibacteria bacterium]